MRAHAAPPHGIREAAARGHAGDPGLDLDAVILALNCGSSSLKYAVFEGERRTGGGAVTGIGVPGGHATHADAVHDALAGLPTPSAGGHRPGDRGPQVPRTGGIQAGGLAEVADPRAFAPPPP